MRCEIRFVGGWTTVVDVPRSTFKVERENAWAMTQGYLATGGRYYLCMYAASESANVLKSGFQTRGAYVPKVLSYRTTAEPNYPVSFTGRQMGVSDYDQPFTLPHKYVAILDRLLHIEGHLHRVQGVDLWDSICSKPGLFDIWEPEAPRNRMLGRFDEEHGGANAAQQPMILVVRVFLLNREVHVEKKTRVDIVDDGGTVSLASAIVPSSRQATRGSGFAGAMTFDQTIGLLKNTIQNHTVFAPSVKETIINDTSLVDA
ncbi:MAG: hypothetical protein ACTSYX_02110 [Candidatus Thorarchaeota archaeon]